MVLRVVRHACIVPLGQLEKSEFDVMCLSRKKTSNKGEGVTLLAGTKYPYLAASGHALRIALANEEQTALHSAHQLLLQDVWTRQRH